MGLNHWFQRCKVYLVFIVVGSLLMSSGGILWYTYYNPPSYSCDPTYNGFSIVRNSTDIDDPCMDIMVSVEPLNLYFHFSFVTEINGTYNFLFRFPFVLTDVESLLDNSDDVSIIETDRGSLVCIQRSVIINGPWERVSIGGTFTLEDTFTSGSKGYYMIQMPFGEDLSHTSFVELENAKEKLDIDYVDLTVKTHLFIDLPYSYEITGTFPQISNGLRQSTEYAGKILQLNWDFDRLRETVIIRYQDNSLIQFFDNILFLGGIFFGIGSSIVVTAFYDWAKDSWRKPQFYDKK